MKLSQQIIKAFLGEKKKSSLQSIKDKNSIKYFRDQNKLWKTHDTSEASVI